MYSIFYIDKNTGLTNSIYMARTMAELWKEERKPEEDERIEYRYRDSHGEDIWHG